MQYKYIFETITLHNYTNIMYWQEGWSRGCGGLTVRQPMRLHWVDPRASYGKPAAQVLPRHAGPS